VSFSPESPSTQRRGLRAISTLAISAAVLAGAPAVAGATCKDVQHRARVESGVFKTDLAYLYLRFRVCYDGKTITKVSRKEIEPSFTNNAVNMHWDGLTTKPVERYESWHGRKKGAFYLKASGKFSQSVGPVGSDFLRWVSMRVTADGHVDKDRSN
jgi:hypothetical protein